ncbi:clostripain-related cysteine peptidase [Candidatus Chloroploca sp. Khr17]|uniref:clostripain-related cysteine peptidase n=1 Tax=Candidatus Chloroploca sp. Khr17 TaxID=2496869 RepID=UPI0013EA7F1C|nr:clostripain-related cysteine peptidase [Candidatus Chloroploca sp. Khr17]
MASLGHAGPGQAQPGVDRFVPGARPPRSFPTLQILEGELNPASSVVTCRQVLADPQVNLAAQASPWKEYRSQRSFSDEEPFSGTQALLLSPTDAVAATGQVVTLPAGVTELYGALQYRYAQSSTSPGDQVQIAFFASEDGVASEPPLVTVKTREVAQDDDATWRLLEWEVLDAAVLAELRSRGRFVFVVQTIRTNQALAQQLWLDDLRANVCFPTTSLAGQVRTSEGGVASALVLLIRSNATGSAVLASTRSDANGSYRFVGVPPLVAGSRYQIWYRDLPVAPLRIPGRTGFWAGPPLTSLAEGASVTGLDLDVTGVTLLEPASYTTTVATDTAPVLLRWQGRATAGTFHQVCVYDPVRGDPATGLPVEVCGPVRAADREPLSFALSPASFADVPAFAFTYGRSYRWYVVIYAGDPRLNSTVEYGYSQAERAITLLPAPASPFAPPPLAEPGEPARAASDAAWTLLIYLAGDNMLGDRTRLPWGVLPAQQLAWLPALATAYPQVNLISLADYYGPRGAELCVYAAQTPPDCRARGAINSADPATLAAFIAAGRARYPATHTALLVITPAQAAGWLALDEHPGEREAPAALNLDDLQAAYRAAGLEGDNRLDLVIYQAPVMGSLDVLAATAPYARAMVGSSDQMWQITPWQDVLSLLAGAGRDEIPGVAAGVVEAYAAAAGPERAFSLVAYDLRRSEALLAQVETFALALRTELTTTGATTRPALREALTKTQRYDSSGNGLIHALNLGNDRIAAQEDALIDLYSLAVEVAAIETAPDTVRTAAETLVVWLEDETQTPVLVHRASAGESLAGFPISFPKAQGLAIFFPSGERLGQQQALFEQYVFDRPDSQTSQSEWARLLTTYLEPIPGRGPGGITEGTGGIRVLPMPGGLQRPFIYVPVVRR